MEAILDAWNDFLAKLSKCMNADVKLDFCTPNVRFALLKMYMTASSF